MSRGRTLTFQFPGSQPAKPAQVVAETPEHICAVCGARHASFGYAVNEPGGMPVRWYCHAHWPDRPVSRENAA
ncbi:hypothetical protein [Microvirga antarctica]|uniref:hypothetical protein n=1 Tax=Microvirga antarctica TaxID=2819233 RepID=UPI001B314C2D|nr:hypothetical protein [Microvirga antarctica]